MVDEFGNDLMPNALTEAAISEVFIERLPPPYAGLCFQKFYLAVAAAVCLHYHLLKVTVLKTGRKQIILIIHNQIGVILYSNVKESVVIHQ